MIFNEHCFYPKRTEKCERCGTLDEISGVFCFIGYINHGIGRLSYDSKYNHLCVNCAFILSLEE